MTNESICSICGEPEEVTGTDGAGELTYKPHKHEVTVLIALPADDLYKTKKLIEAIYNPADPNENLKLLIANRLYTYRRDMIDHVKRLDKKRAKELEQYL